MKTIYFILALVLMTSCGNIKTFDLTITVQDNFNYKTVSGASVVCESSNGDSDTLTTNSEGKVVFTKDKKGDYTIYASRDSVTPLENLWVHENKNFHDAQLILRLIRTEEEWKSQMNKHFEIGMQKRVRTSQNCIPVDTSISKCGEEEVCTIPADFPGGTRLLHQFISDHVRYPPTALDLGDQGRIYVEFVVEKDGEISDIKILKGVSRDLDREAKRIIRKMDRWLPGFCQGKPARTKCTLPIVFTIQ